MIIKAGTYRFNDELIGYPPVETYFAFTPAYGTSWGMIRYGHDPETSWNFLTFGSGLTVVYSYEAFEEEGVPKGWLGEFHGIINEELQTHTIAEQEVDDTFGTWYIANTNYNEVNGIVEETPLATIEYNGQVIASLNAGEKATIPCSQYTMSKDLVVKVNEVEMCEVEPKLQDKQTTIFKNYTTTITPDEGYDGLSSVTVTTNVESGGDVAINGIIEQYKVNAGATVNAGDFVEFVSKYKSGTFCAYSVSYVSACKLDDSRVFIVYIRNSTMEAVVLTIDNGVTSVGTPVTISGTSYVSVTALSSNTVVVSYVQGTNSEATAIAIKIDVTTITAGESVYLDYMNISQTKAVALTENKALIAFRYTRYNNDPKNYAVVVTVDDTTITKGTVVLLQNSGDFDIIALDESHLFFVAEGNDYISGYILTINDTTIISTSGFGLASGFYPKCTLLDTNKVLVAFCSSSISRAIIATVEFGENNQITRGTSSYEFSTAYFDNNGEVVALNKNKALVIYGNEGKCTILTIDGETITVGTEADFDANTVSHTSLLAFSENSALVVYNNSTGAFAGLTIDGDTITVNTTESGTFVQPATSRLHNVGVAKTSGAEGETVEVYCVGEPSANATKL